MPIVAEIRDRLPALAQITEDEVAGGPTPRAVAAMDAFTAPIDGYRSPVAAVSEHAASGPHGDVPIRVYAPAGRPRSGAGLVWMHGGAFVAGDLDMGEADGFARELADRAGLVVASVDYRLVNEHVHFPVPHDDVMAAWTWATAHLRDWGVQPHRLALGGASAGGTLAAGAAFRLRDEALPLPSSLVLAYPALNAQLGPHDGLPADIASLPVVLRFSPEMNAAIFAAYLGNAAPTAYAIPALGDPDGLPPLAILTCEYDTLRPSAEAFAATARDTGVKVTMRCEPGVPHGHLNIRGLAAAEPSLSFIAAAVADHTA